MVTAKTIISNARMNHIREISCACLSLGSEKEVLAFREKLEELRDSGKIRSFSLAKTDKKGIYSIDIRK